MSWRGLATKQGCRGLIAVTEVAEFSKLSICASAEYMRASKYSEPAQSLEHSLRGHASRHRSGQLSKRFVRVRDQCRFIGRGPYAVLVEGPPTRLRCNVALLGCIEGLQIMVREWLARLT